MYSSTNHTVKPSFMTYSNWEVLRKINQRRWNCRLFDESNEEVVLVLDGWVHWQSRNIRLWGSSKQPLHNKGEAKSEQEEGCRSSEQNEDSRETKHFHIKGRRSYWGVWWWWGSVNEIEEDPILCSFYTNRPYKPTPLRLKTTSLLHNLIMKFNNFC